MINIAPSNSQAARELFRPLEHHLLIRAFFENNLKAQLFTDNETRPRAGLIAYNHRLSFGGDPTQAAFNTSLRHHFVETLIHSRHGSGFLVTFTSDSWITTLDTIFSECEVIHAPRMYFEIVPGAAHEIALPQGFSLQLVTPKLLAENIGGLNLLREEMCSERTSIDDFFDKSFGLCLVYENQIAAWCLSEYNTNGRCEIGIATLEPHQRKGIAAMLTKTFLIEAVQRGYGHVGWDCWEKNAASTATARKAGFTLKRQEQAMVVIS